MARYNRKTKRSVKTKRSRKTRRYRKRNVKFGQRGGCGCSGNSDSAAPILKMNGGNLGNATLSQVPSNTVIPIGGPGNGTVGGDITNPVNVVSVSNQPSIHNTPNIMGGRKRGKRISQKKMKLIKGGNGFTDIINTFNNSLFGNVSTTSPLFAFGNTPSVSNGQMLITDGPSNSTTTFDQQTAFAFNRSNLPLV